VPDAGQPVGYPAEVLRDLQQLVRDCARSLLEQGEVGMVIGHRAAAPYGRGVPAFVTEPGEAGQLMVGPQCQVGIGKYLLDQTRATRGRVAVIGRGCDILAARRLIADNRVAPDQVLLLWVPCAGRAVPEAMAKGGAVARHCLQCDVRLPEPGQDGIEIIGAHLAGALASASLVGEGCLEATAPRIAPAGPGADNAGDAGYERWSGWFEHCLRCYACRATCPACNCDICVLESRSPQWVERSTALPQQFMFHFIRAMDVAGRCVNCGECERACPAGIPLMDLQQLVAADITELFGVERPHVPGEHEPLGIFDARDPDPERPARTSGGGALS